MPDLDEAEYITEMTTMSAHCHPHRQQQHVELNDQDQERGCCTECSSCCCCCQCHHGRGRQSSSTTFATTTTAATKKKNLKNQNYNQERHSTATAATTIINIEEEEESSDGNDDLMVEQDEGANATTVSSCDSDGGGTCRKSHRSSNVGKIFCRIFDTVGPTGISVALIWLGIWGLLDLYLFPTNVILSASVCIALSIPLVAVCEVLQIRNNDENETKNKTKQEQKQNLDRIALAILTTLAGVLFWRGVWYLWDNLVFVNNPTLQKCLALIIGPVILLVNGTCQASVVGAPAMFPPPREQAQTNSTTIGRQKRNVSAGDIEIDDMGSISVELSTGTSNS